MNRLRSQPTSAETAATKQTGDAHFAVQTLFGSAITEFEDGTSPEARCARDADKLDCLLRALEYRAGGVPAVQGKIDRCRAALTTVAAQRIADAAPALDPTDWQYTWTSRSDVTAAEVSVSARLEAGQAAVADRLVVMVSAYELKCSHVRTNVQSCLQRPRGDAGSARHEEECSA